MANAKTYNDLTSASEVSATDKFAVAKEGETELQTVTTQQVVQEVASELTDGAMSELVYATSQGKQALATALTNKGAATEASETLIQMSDKLNNLNIDTLSDKLVGSIYYNGGVTSQSALSLTPLASCKLVNGYVATTASGTLYVYKLSGNYASITEALAAAEMSIELQNRPSGKYAYITCSKDGKTIISHAFDAAGTVDIYSVDYDAKSLQYVKSITGITSYTNYARIAVTNDRNLIAWYARSNTDNSIAYIMNINTNVKSASLSAELNATNTQIAFDDDNNTLYIVDTTPHLLKYVYEVSEDAITFTKTIYQLNKLPHYLDKETLLLFAYGSPYTVDTSNVYYNDIFIADATKGDIVYAQARAYYIFNAANLPSNYPIYPINSANPIISILDSVYTIQFVNPDLTLTYNRTTNTVTYNDTYRYVDIAMFVSYASAIEYGIWPLSVAIAYNPSTLYYIACRCPESNTSNYTASPGDRICYAQANANKLLGYKHSVNNVVAKFTYPSYSVSDMNNGLFDINTTIQPVVPESQG